MLRWVDKSNTLIFTKQNSRNGHAQIFPEIRLSSQPNLGITKQKNMSISVSKSMIIISDITWQLLKFVLPYQNESIQDGFLPTCESVLAGWVDIDHRIHVEVQQTVEGKELGSAALVCRYIWYKVFIKYTRTKPEHEHGQADGKHKYHEDSCEL